MTEYEKKELARAYEEMKPENFLKNISSDDIDLVFGDLSNEEIDKLQQQIKEEIIDEANKLDWWSDSLSDQIDVISKMAADEIGKG